MVNSMNIHRIQNIKIQRIEDHNGFYTRKIKLETRDTNLKIECYAEDKENLEVEVQ